MDVEHACDSVSFWIAIDCLYLRFNLHPTQNMTRHRKRRQNNELEEAFGGMEPAKRMLRKRQEGDEFGMSNEDSEELLDTLEQLEELAKQFEAEFNEKKRRRRR